MRSKFLGAVSAVVLSMTPYGVSAQAEEASQKIDIGAQSLQSALLKFSEQTDIVVVAPSALVKNKTAPKVVGNLPPYQALSRLLVGSGLKYARGADGEITIVSSADQIGIAANASSTQLAMYQNSEQQNDATSNSQDQAVRQTGNSQEEEDLMELQEIIVTGSHIRGAGAVGSKVFTYDRSEIDLQGFATLPDFMRSLPQNFNGGFSESTAAQFGGSSAASRGNLVMGSGVNLRGLGNTSTLVLLDGQRLSPAGSDGSFVDISMIPLAAIESIEVLADGASATYGSDAVGGVVNYKVRKDYDGAETRMRYGFATQGGLEEIQVGQTFGRAWDDGHALITGEYGSRDALDAKDRPFSEDAPEFNHLLPEHERYSIFATGGQKLADNLEVSTKAYFSRRDSARLVNQPRPAPLPPAIPFSSLTSATKQYGGTLGVTVDLGDTINNDWRIKVVGGYNRLDTNIETFEFAAQTVTGTTIRESETTSLDALADGTIFTLPGGKVKLAVGGHYREEDFFNPTAMTRFDRNVKAAFGELFVPLVGEDNRMPGVEKLEVSMALRYEDYSDFGNTTDPKIGVKWSPFEGLNLRGTYSTSFRAPLLTELDDSANFAFLLNATNAQGGSNVLVALAGDGNPALQPESADIWTAGFDFSPAALSGLNVSATYFSIEYKDRILAPPFISLFSILTDPTLAELIDLNAPDAETQAMIDRYGQFNFTTFIPPLRDFSDADAVFRGFVSNIARTETSGIDFSASYALETVDSGTFNFSVGGTYLLDFMQQVTASAPAQDALNVIQNPVDLRLNGGVSWTLEGFTASVRLSHIDGYTDNISDPDGVPVDSWTTTDLSLRYNTGDRFGGWLDNTSFVVSARNLFDQNPPFVQSLRQNSEVNYDPNAHSPEGRVLSFNIVKQW
ncbi:TonB-dependent receptor [Paremcibacter congregatus]|nr:TonB-dependent receptor [Paremcibacter congregatus]